MTPTERLQAAIDKLEQLRTGSTQGEWWATHGRLSPDIFAGTGSSDDVLVVSDGHLDADAELIVTLHRTIDAQLSLLRHAEKFLASVGHHTSNIAGPFIDDALNLADAIIGTPALAEGGDRG